MSVSRKELCIRGQFTTFSLSELQLSLSLYGNVNRLELLKSIDTKGRKSMLVEYQSEIQAENARNALHNKKLGSEFIFVDFHELANDSSNNSNEFASFSISEKIKKGDQKIIKRRILPNEENNNLEPKVIKLKDFNENEKPQLYTKKNLEKMIGKNNESNELETKINPVTQNYFINGNLNNQQNFFHKKNQINFFNFHYNPNNFVNETMKQLKNSYMQKEYLEGNINSEIKLEKKNENNPESISFSSEKNVFDKKDIFINNNFNTANSKFKSNIQKNEDNEHKKMNIIQKKSDILDHQKYDPKGYHSLDLKNKSDLPQTLRKAWKKFFPSSSKKPNRKDLRRFYHKMFHDFVFKNHQKHKKQDNNDIKIANFNKYQHKHSICEFHSNHVAKENDKKRKYNDHKKIKKYQNYKPPKNFFNWKKNENYHTFNNKTKMYEGRINKDKEKKIYQTQNNKSIINQTTIRDESLNYHPLIKKEMKEENLNFKQENIVYIQENIKHEENIENKEENSIKFQKIEEEAYVENKGKEEIEEKIQIEEKTTQNISEKEAILDKIGGQDSKKLKQILNFMMKGGTLSDLKANLAKKISKKWENDIK